MAEKETDMHHKLYGVRIDDFEHSDVLKILAGWLDEDQRHMVVTPNPEMILQSRTDVEFRNILNTSDLSIADGVGLRFAIAALTDKRLRHRHTGVDLVDDLAMLCRDAKKRLVLFGGDPFSASKARDVLQQRYPNLDVVDFDPGPIDIDTYQVAELGNIRPDVLLVALGHGKQERFIHQHLSLLSSVKIAVGVGGSFESISGIRPRAPKTMRRIGLEWIWRLLIEPRRFKRIFTAFPIFPIVVVWSTLKSRRFLRACKATIPEIFRQLRGL